MIMSEFAPSTQFEEEVRAAVATPLAPEEFIKNLYAHVMQQAVSRPEPRRLIRLRPVWVSAFIIAVLLVSFLAIGPLRVVAAVRGLFGYIPGVGVVDQSAPIRVLAEPVTVKRDEIYVTINSAILTRDKTHIEYRIFGVPGSAYPDREDVAGCTQPPYLRLPDGAQLEQIGNDFPPVPGDVNNAVFVLPCILNTLPGKAPEHWELPVRFEPAPPDLTVMPVIELSPTHKVYPTPSATALPDNPTSTPVAVKENTPIAAQANTPVTPVTNAVIVSKEIDTNDGYILVGRLVFPDQSEEWAPLSDYPDILDASGKKVSYTYPQDIMDMVDTSPGGIGWAVQFKAAGLVYPLTIIFSSPQIIQADPQATAVFSFDAGPNPVPGQEWTPDQEIQLAGHTLKLTSISVDSRNGYSFMFQADPKVYGADLQIDGYTPVGGGGGGMGGLTDGKFDLGLSYAQLPTGVLTVTVSNLTFIGDPITWQGQWSPASLHTALPANPTPQLGLCLSYDTLTQLQPVPADLSNGKVLLFQENDAAGKWGLVLYSLDGSQKQVVTQEGNWGSLSPDGSTVAYSATDNAIHLVDVASQTDRILAQASGTNIHWSPDGKQIAYIGIQNGAIDSVFIIFTDETQLRQVSDWSYESIIGWSPDGAQLYYAAPYTGGAAWKVYAYDLATGQSQEQFTIENGTPKFLNPQLSPDGQWIAYRGRDNSSLYLVHPDGSDMHLALDSLNVVGIAWSRSGWLGVSLSVQNTGEPTVIILKPAGCEAYRLLNIPQGDIEGLYVP
jgi:hypothetical protein